MKRICIVVLGDVGRSPRMRYHALSFAKEGYYVDLVGYDGSVLPRAMLENDNISVKYVMQPPDMKHVPQLCRFFLKVLWQMCLLFVSIMMLKRPDLIMVQNPPSIPTLFVVWIVKNLKRCRLMIDWHNYGYSILSLKLQNSHPLVKFSKWFEMYFGKKSDHNLCVTSAMKEDLANNWKLHNISVLYDRPSEIYRSIDDISEIHSLFTKLKEEYDVFEGECDDETVCTKRIMNEVKLKEDRPAVIISSTSWTEDEDFTVLLSALENYDDKVKENRNFRDILCIVTGKGPLKEFYCNLFAEKDLDHVKFCTPWLSAEDYALLLASCDLGISLHFSSSGLDLPMKVVDMFGCGLPVCAYNFKCIDELVKHQENGMVFQDRKQLSNYFIELFQDFPVKKRLNEFRKNLKSFQRVQWHQSWRQIVLPVADALTGSND